MCVWRSRSRPALAASDRPTSGDGIAPVVNARRTAGQKSPMEEVFVIQSAMMVKRNKVKAFDCLSIQALNIVNWKESGS